MLIPSIDLMEGKIVQLVQGEKKALEFDDFEPWLERFSKYPMVQIVDLDAALGRGDNCKVVQHLVGRLRCQVGGGIRSLEKAQEFLAEGAQRVVIGSALIQDGSINTAFAEKLANQVDAERLVFAADSKGGKVATHGWRRSTEISALQMIRVLEPWCGHFLYTHIDTEGLMLGIPLEIVAQLRRATAKGLIVAGGITTESEIRQLEAMKVDAIVGMAVYRGLLEV